MKKVFILSVSLLLVTLGTYAQAGKFQLNVGPEVNIPVGSFGDFYKTGFGGSLKALYGVSKSGQVTLTAGYSSFKGKGNVNGFNYSSLKLGILPILLGYRQ